MPSDKNFLPETRFFRCIKNFIMNDGEIAFAEGKEYEAHPWFSGEVVFRNDQGTPHAIAPNLLIEYFVKIKVKAEEIRVIEEFIKLCIESMTPTLFDVLVDEIIPALEKYRHIKVRSVKELGEEMGVK